MQTLWTRRCLCTALMGTLPIGTLLPGLARAAKPALPRRDLTVELRQVKEGEGREEGAVHYGAGSEEVSTWEPQTVQVRNGEKALLRLNDAIPMQWTQSVSTQNASGHGGAASRNGNNNNEASVTNALVWFDVGQSLSVQPSWPGGKQPAVVLLEVQRSTVDARTGAVLPAQSRNTVSTVVTVPLAEWVTVAATGRALKPGIYSSEAGLAGRRLLQVRVMVP